MKVLPASVAALAAAVSVLGDFAAPLDASGFAFAAAAPHMV